MVAQFSKSEQFNVLASDANWAWPSALRDIFEPRGVNLMVARSTNEFVNVIEQKRIHTTIVDMDSRTCNGLAMIKIIRMHSPLLPCVLLADKAEQDLLGKALHLNVSGVVDKPVQMNILQQLLDRVFMKKYNSDIFADETVNNY